MRLWIALLAAALSLGVGYWVLGAGGAPQVAKPPSTQHPAPNTAPGATVDTKEMRQMMHAKGEFEVKLVPLQDELPEKMGRMSIDKTFTGDLAGTGRGQMIHGMGEVEGSGVYVAVERVTGTIGGRSGSFLLYHQGIMTRGTPDLKISVVPDSGTGDFKGITGTLNITITEGKHFYDFEYAL